MLLLLSGQVKWVKQFPFAGTMLSEEFPFSALADQFRKNHLILLKIQNPPHAKQLRGGIKRKRKEKFPPAGWLFTGEVPCGSVPGPAPEAGAPGAACRALTPRWCWRTGQLPAILRGRMSAQRWNVFLLAGTAGTHDTIPHAGTSVWKRDVADVREAPLGPTDMRRGDAAARRAVRRKGRCDAECAICVVSQGGSESQLRHPQLHCHRARHKQSPSVWHSSGRLLSSPPHHSAMALRITKAPSSKVHLISDDIQVRVP